MATFIEKMKLFRGLLNKEVAHVGPFSVAVDVTRRCNMRCPGCRYHSSVMENMPSPGNQEVSDLDPSLFEQLCKELRSIGTKTLVFIGEGEPFLHRRLFNFVNTAKDAGMFSEILTNGTLLNEKNIDSLVESRLDNLKVSLWCSTEDEYRKNYPEASPDNFDKIIGGLQRLQSAKRKRGRRLPTITLHHPINRNNFKGLDALVALAQKTGSQALSFSPLKTRRGALTSTGLDQAEEREVCCALSNIEKQLNSLGIRHNIKQTLLRYEIGEAVSEKLPCYIGWIHARVKVDGTVLPCNPCDLPMGNLYESNMREIWNNAKFRSFRRRALTRQGLMSLNSFCDCGYCCHLETNWRIHRLYKSIGNWRS